MRVSHTGQEAEDQGRNPSTTAAQTFKRSEMDAVCPRMLAWDAGVWGEHGPEITCRVGV